MTSESSQWYFRGMRNAVPIGLGYFAVSFTLGIAAKKTGLTAIQAALMSAAMHASAGQFAAYGLIGAGAGVMEMVVTEFVINLRYLLMSGALSQKVRQDKSCIHRFFMAFCVTDEIFGISMAVPEKLHPAYMYGAMSVASPGWILGTFFGALMGMVMPGRVLSAMNVALYGMFLAVVVPPAKKSKIIAGAVLISMAVSGCFQLIPGARNLSSGFQIILLTVMIAGIFAVLFPVEEEEKKHAS